MKDIPVPPAKIIMERTGSPPIPRPEHNNLRSTTKELKVYNKQRIMPPKISYSHDSHENTQKVIVGSTPGNSKKDSGTFPTPSGTKIHVKRGDDDSTSTSRERPQKLQKQVETNKPAFYRPPQSQTPFRSNRPFSGSSTPVHLAAGDFKSFANPVKSKPTTESQGMGEQTRFGSDSSLSDNEFSQGAEDSDAEESSVSTRNPGDFQGMGGMPAMEEEVEQPTKQMSSSERKQLKYDLLSKIQALERKGINPSKRFTSKHKLVHIQSEYNRLSQMLANEAGVKFGRKLLMGGVGIVEWLNNRFDPVGAKLEGWSESVMENIEDFDHSLERTVEKWTSHVEVAPEMELMTALAGSAFMFHMSKSILANPAAIFSAMGSQKPDMMENMMKKMMGGLTSKMSTPDKDDGESSGDDMSPPTMNFNPMSRAGEATRGKDKFSQKEVSDESETDEDDEFSGSETSSESSAGKNISRMVSIPNKKK